MPTIGANIIIRNEEKRIGTLLSILRPYMDQIVVVDQESTDSSAYIARGWADKVLHDKCTGYADSSRQLAMDNTNTDWILTIDADEFPTNRFLKQLPEFVEDRLADGYYLSVCLLRCKEQNELPLDYILNIGTFIDVPHESISNCYRLYKKDRVVINNKLNGGIGPRSGDLVRFWLYNAIVEIKTFAEQQIDADRYLKVQQGIFIP